MQLAQQWARLSTKPGGKWLFSVMAGRFAPYTGTIKSRVQEIEAGRAVVTLRDRRKVRNHLKSVHATALVTFGEFASGLAMLAGMPPKLRAIVTKIEIEYLKKARGTLTAHGAAPIPDGEERREYIATASIRNEDDEEVARMNVTWLVGP